MVHQRYQRYRLRTLRFFGCLAMPSCIVPAVAESKEPMGSIPIGSVSDWIASTDYPADAIRARRQGNAVFELLIDTQGLPISCKIVQKSGTDSLDRATCKAVMANARFDPAKDRNGHATRSVYRNTVAWKLPDNVPVVESAEQANDAPDTTSAEYEFVIGENGLIKSCKVISVEPADSVEPCKRTLPGSVAPIQFKRNGKYLPLKVLYKSSVTVTSFKK